MRSGAAALHHDNSAAWYREGCSCSDILFVLFKLLTRDLGSYWGERTAF